MKISWRNILYPHKFPMHMDDFRNCALDLEYPYFAWNGRVYHTKTNDMIGTVEGVVENSRYGHE